MKGSDSKGMKFPNFLSNELVTAADVMFFAESGYKNLTDIISHCAMALGIYSQDGTNDFVINGLGFSFDTLNLTVAAGLAVSFSGRYYTNNVFSFTASPGELFSVVIPEEVIVGIDNNSAGTYARIDIVEIRPTYEFYDSATRQFRDPATKEETSSLMNTKAEYGYEIQVTKGDSEIDDYVPSSSVGWIKIGEVIVAAGTSTILYAYDSDEISSWHEASPKLINIRSTPEALAHRSVQRDVNGRAKVSDPSDASDIATKGYVDSAASGGVTYKEIQYLTNPNFENLSGTTGWNVYNDGSSSIPVDGTGGTVTALVLSRNITNPLFDDADMIITKAAINGQGQGFSTDFSIDEGAKDGPIYVKFTYRINSSGSGFTDNDIGIYVYDVDNAVILNLSETDLISASGSLINYIGTFLPNNNSLNYRLIFHIQQTTATAFEMEIDNIYVGPSTKYSVSPIGEWQSYTPIFTGFGTVSTYSIQWRRVGSNLEIRGRFTAGTVTATEARISLPLGLTSISTISTLEYAGGIAYDAQASYERVCLIEPSISYLTFGYAGSGSGSLSKGNASTLFSSSDVISFLASVPIAQWSTNINLASDFTEYAFNTQASIDTSDTTSFGYGSGGTAILANTAATYYDVQFKKPIQNTDDIKLQVKSIVDNNWIDSQLAEVPSLFATLSRIGYYNSNVYAKGMALAKIASNKVRVFFFKNCMGGSSYTDSASSSPKTWAQIIAASDGFTHWRVKKVSNGNMAEVPPLVFASYYSATNGISTTANTPMDFPTVLEDTHGAVTTGSAWKFTAPVDGLYLITGHLYYNVNGDVNIYKNGVYLDKIGYAQTTYHVETSLSYTIRLRAGEYFDLRDTTTGSPQAGRNIQITRIGN